MDGYGDYGLGVDLLDEASGLGLNGPTDEGGDETALPALAQMVKPDDATLRADLKWALSELMSRADVYTLYREYYDGQHRLAFATARWRNAFGELYRRFFDNISKIVVTTAVDRLEVTGFETVDGQESSDAQELWDESNMDLRAKQVHREALREGDAYVIVWPDEQGQPRIAPQKAHLCCVRYEQENLDEIELGAKWFIRSDGRGQVNLYYRGGISKWVTRNKLKSSGLPSSPTSYVPVDDGPDWIPNEYGVCPMFHFGNDADAGDYGSSELADVIPLQDALNKAILDMMVGHEYVALPQRYMTGIDLETQYDEDAQEERPVNPFKPGVDSVWVAGSKDARFGQFDAGDFAQLIAVQEKYRVEIARVSRTPLHFVALEGDWPSGEALKTAEGPFVSKIVDDQLQFGAVWKKVMQLALAMAGRPVQDAQRLKPRWASAETRVGSLVSQEMTMKSAVGVPEEQIWKELGYTDDEIKTFSQMRQQQMELEAQAFAMGHGYGQPDGNAGGSGGNGNGGGASGAAA